MNINPWVNSWIMFLSLMWMKLIEKIAQYETFPSRKLDESDPQYFDVNR